MQMWKMVRHYYLFVAAAGAAILALALQAAGFRNPAHAVLGLVALAELVPLLVGMWRDFRTGSWGVDVLAAVAIFSSVWLGQYWAGIVVVLMLTGGEALEDYAGHRAERELTDLLQHAPQKAHILRNKKEQEVAASEVRTGDQLVVRPGELLPVDAVVLEGEADVDESSLTGESLPKAASPGSELLSGSLNTDGSLVVRALRPAAESQYQQIVQLVRAAQHSQAPFVRMADRYAAPFTVVSFGIAVAAWAVSGQAIRFLEVIVVATPCPLILAAPIAIISGMSRASKQGIIIKNGGALEQLARARTFAFDKTGTLTRGELQVARVVPFGKATIYQVLRMAASIEQHSMHVQARAILQRAAQFSIKIEKVGQVRELAGRGMVAMHKGREIVVGRLALLQDRHVELPKSFKADAYNQTAAFVAADGHLIGVISFVDEIRAEAPQALAALQKFGIGHFLMVTGDARRTAQTVARRLKIPQVVAGALPADKIKALENAASRPIAFVGDGVNDAPVLTASDVGIALGARGSAAAAESADVVIMPDSLTYVALSLAIAKRTFAIARQSILVGIGLSVVLMVVFASGRFLPIYGAVIQELVDIVVIFNALRAHTGQVAAE